MVREYVMCPTCLGGHSADVMCPCGAGAQGQGITPSGYVDRFDEVLKEMSALHSKKGADYGGVGDPYANVRASADFGVPPWVGALIRLNDKITRLKSFIRRGTLENESVLDSIQDIAVYAVIMRVLYEEQEKP